MSEKGFDQDTLTLKPDAKYHFVVSMGSKDSTESIQSNPSIPSKRYKPATLEVMVDWRGASWGSLKPGSLRCAVRGGNDGSIRDDDVGFRLVVSR